MAEDHADSWRVYNGLGRAYLKQGRNEEAVACLKKSLKLNPDNKNAERTLRELEEKKEL